jgi:hypothetical protein
MARRLSDLLGGVIGILSTTNVLAVPAHAQLTDLPAEPTEARISVVDPEGDLHACVGRIEPWSSDSLALELDSRAFHTFGHDVVASLEIKTGSKGAWLPGLLIEAGVGLAAALGILVGRAIWTDRWEPVEWTGDCWWQAAR